MYDREKLTRIETRRNILEVNNLTITDNAQRDKLSFPSSRLRNYLFGLLNHSKLRLSIGYFHERRILPDKKEIKHLAVLSICAWPSAYR